MVKITVNGREVEADPKQPLIKACHGNGVEVPHYCYHPGLSTVGSCRMCQVEVQQGQTPGRVMVACRTYPAEGMVVHTESDKAHATRRECLEFLLKNHPLDCPICDKAGECDLQDYTYQEGQSTGRSKEPRRPAEKRHSLGDVIVLDQERCVLCSRCVRFFEEVPKKAQLTVSSLGSRSVISSFADKPLTGNYQGNIADLCPVGALTLKGFRFQARVWNLVKQASTCPECSRGCSIQVEVLRGGDVKRFRPRENPAVNQWWMCDTGRFAFGHVNAKDRLANAVVRGEHGPEARSIEDGIAVVQALLDAHSDALFVASPFCTVEEGAAIQALAKRRGTHAFFVAPGPNGLKDDLLHTGDPCPNRRGLAEAGLQPIEPKALAKQLATVKAAVLFGERVVELAGQAAIEALPTTTTLAVFDCAAPEAAACAVAIGVPTWVERSGTYVNVDGHRGPISAVKPAPAGVRALERHLAALAIAEGAEAARS